MYRDQTSWNGGLGFTCQGCWRELLPRKRGSRSQANRLDMGGAGARSIGRVDVAGAHVTPVHLKGGHCHAIHRHGPTQQLSAVTSHIWGNPARCSYPARQA
jgi:hypothetical protein